MVLNAGLGGTPGGNVAGMPGGVPNPLLGGTPVSSDNSFKAGIQVLLPAVFHNTVESGSEVNHECERFLQQAKLRKESVFLHHMSWL